MTMEFLETVDARGADAHRLQGELASELWPPPSAQGSRYAGHCRTLDCDDVLFVSTHTTPQLARWTRLLASDIVWRPGSARATQRLSCIPKLDEVTAVAKKKMEARGARQSA